MSVRCGNCKQDHEAVADVRACYEHAGKTASSTPTPSGGPQWPASPKQVDYVLGLQKERNLPDDYKVKDVDALRLLERDQVSGLIGLLKTFSKRDGGTTQPQYDMPAGRYALTDDDNVWRFYELTKPSDGRWKGYTFIKLLVGSPGQYRKVDMHPGDRRRVLGIIEANTRQAMTDYGLQSGVCGKCSSPLTDPESLARGIGPVCFSKLGW